MIKQIIREINTGSWKSTEDYLNIINQTNTKISTGKTKLFVNPSAQSAERAHPEGN